MLLEKRIIAFVKLGTLLREYTLTKEPRLEKAVKNAIRHNGWFTEENILLAIHSLGEMLREAKIRKWIDNYESIRHQVSGIRNIGVIMAGNIPLVGFHDFLCVLMSGHNFAGKLSSDDEHLLPALADILIQLEPEFKEKIRLTPTLSKGEGAFSSLGRDREGWAFITTGSNNSARYFEYYFGKHPHIIRKNRNSIAILDGDESEEDLKNLGRDIFQYFGMGCRNVSKIYIPQNYNLDKFFSAIVDFGDVINHNKYYNNHCYYHSIYLLNQEKFLDNNFLMLKEAPSYSPERGETIASPVATLYYERYNNLDVLFKKLSTVKEQLQCIAYDQTLPPSLENIRVRYGQTQSPELWEYADGVDTMEFLISLK